MDEIGQGIEAVLIGAVEFVPKLIVALVVFVLFLFFSGVISRALGRTLEKRKVDAELTILFRKITRWTVIILGSALALEQVNFDLTAFLAGLGIVGFTVGFAIQDVSKNFVAGLLLLLQQPFDIGDLIEVSGFTGKVQAVDLRATELRTLDGRYVEIPNADVFTNAIVNYSRADRRRIELSVGISYESDPERVRQIAVQAIQGVDGLLADPAPVVYFKSFGASAFDFSLFYWIDTNVSDPTIAQDQGLSAI